MQFGNVLPSPTINDEPHGFAPRIFPSHCREYMSYCADPVIACASLAITESPAPCDVVSPELHTLPSAHASLPACVIASCTCFRNCAFTAACVSASPFGAPAF